MNTVVLCGRLTKDPDVKVTANAKIARYTMAVDRAAKKQDGAREADFISCVAFNNAADFAERYLHKGTKILIDGRIQTGSYTNKDGQTVYTTEVIINHHEFVEPRTGEPTAPVYHSGYSQPQSAPEQKQSSSYDQTSMEDFMPIDDYAVDDEELPFN